MKIAKALKLKNRLAGEISRLKGIVQARNVREETQEQVYDVKRIVDTDLPNRINDLVTVKTAIAMANAGWISAVNPEIIRTPYWAIFMIAELKGMVEVIRSLDTKNGPVNDRHAYMPTGEAKPTVYIASLKQVDVDALVANLEKRIDSLQDTLDVHNATADWAILDEISI